MEISIINDNKNELKLKVPTNEESLFMLLKSHLEEVDEVDIVGITKEHHLIDDTEFYLRTYKEDAKKVFKEALTNIKKDLGAMKLK